MAVTLFECHHSAELDCKPVPISMFLGDDTISKSNVGAGDEVYFSGLFNRMNAQSKNMPIVRSGNLALLSECGTKIAKWNNGNKVVDIEAHLIEARSLGGLSGSPVFIRETVTVEKFLPKPTSMSLPGSFYLLGLTHGHWSILSEDINKPSPPWVDSKTPGAVNVGIAIVIPAKNIKEVLDQPELVATINRMDQDILDCKGTTEPD